MTTVIFTIAGQPFAKQRPRFVKSTGRTFTPDATVKFETIVREIGLQLMREPFRGPVSVTIDAVFAPPKSWSDRKRKALLGTPHIQKPDNDNVSKAILDGLNRVAFVDDSQVADLSSRKRWGADPRTVVTIECIG